MLPSDSYLVAVQHKIKQVKLVTDNLIETLCELAVTNSGTASLECTMPVVTFTSESILRTNLRIVLVPTVGNVELELETGIYLEVYKNIVVTGMAVKEPPALVEHLDTYVVVSGDIPLDESFEKDLLCYYELTDKNGLTSTFVNQAQLISETECRCLLPENTF